MITENRSSDGDSNDRAVTDNTGNHYHTITVVGSSATDPETSPHENRPPYYVLAFIIKY